MALEFKGVSRQVEGRMNEVVDPQVWPDAPGAPVAKLDNEKPQGITISDDELIKSWQK